MSCHSLCVGEGGKKEERESIIYADNIMVMIRNSNYTAYTHGMEMVLDNR